ncbi:FkbM family methyltransferase [Aeromicrobium sp. P5_D10]
MSPKKPVEAGTVRLIGTGEDVIAESVAPMLNQMRRSAAKLRWGVKVVGPVAALNGLFRLAGLLLRRPAEGIVHLRSGPVLGFSYPRQLVPALVAFGDYIDPEMDFLRRVSRPDWVVLDVGAAIGQFSVFAAMLPTAHVHAFEPSSDNITTLKANLRRNRVADHVTIAHMALSDSDAEMTFPTLQNPFLSRLDHGQGSVSGEPVSVRTLSGTVDILGLEHVNCLKINVAGFEAEVLEGSAAFLARQGADVLVILISEGSVPWFPKIAALGYRFFYFHPPRNTLYEVEDLDDVSHDRPWPARHLIGVSGHGIERGLLDQVEVVTAR